jgi:protein-disulfide isomerase
MKNNSNLILVGVSILAGIIVLGSFTIFYKQEEKVTLPIKFEEFADFQCPACGYYSTMVEKVVASYGTDNLDYHFYNFPLTSIHEYAYNASLAGEAANKQGKYKEYAHILFTNNIEFSNTATSTSKATYLSDDSLFGYAAQLNLDIVKFKTDMMSDEVKNIVEADITEANKRNINATPTFYINGKKFNLAGSTATTAEEAEADVIRQFKEAIDAKILLAMQQKEGK